MFRILEIFENSLIFLKIFFGLLGFKITKITTKIYQGYYWAPKIAKNGLKQHYKLFLPNYIIAIVLAKLRKPIT